MALRNTRVDVDRLVDWWFVRINACLQCGLAHFHIGEDVESK